MSVMWWILHLIPPNRCFLHGTALHSPRRSVGFGAFHARTWGARLADLPTVSGHCWCSLQENTTWIVLEDGIEHNCSYTIEYYKPSFNTNHDVSKTVNALPDTSSSSLQPCRIKCTAHLQWGTAGSASTAPVVHSTPWICDTGWPRNSNIRRKETW